MTAREALDAAQLLAPVVEQVADWIGGRSEHEPPVLAHLPTELRSEVALRRARARMGTAGSAPPDRGV